MGRAAAGSIRETAAGAAPAQHRHIAPEYSDHIQQQQASGQSVIVDVHAQNYICGAVCMAKVADAKLCHSRVYCAASS